MNKVFFTIICISTSFLCSMDPQQPSPRSLPPSDTISVRHRMPSNPILRVKRQSEDSSGLGKLVKEENIIKDVEAFMARKRSGSEGK